MSTRQKSSIRQATLVDIIIMNITKGKSVKTLQME